MNTRFVIAALVLSALYSPLAPACDLDGIAAHGRFSPFMGFVVKPPTEYSSSQQTSEQTDSETVTTEETSVQPSAKERVKAKKSSTEKSESSDTKDKDASARKRTQTPS